MRTSIEGSTSSGMRGQHHQYVNTDQFLKEEGVNPEIFNLSDKTTDINVSHFDPVWSKWMTYPKKRFKSYSYSVFQRDNWRSICLGFNNDQKEEVIILLNKILKELKEVPIEEDKNEIIYSDEGFGYLIIQLAPEYKPNNGIEHNYIHLGERL